MEGLINETDHLDSLCLVRMLWEQADFESNSHSFSRAAATLPSETQSQKSLGLIAISLSTLRKYSHPFFFFLQTLRSYSCRRQCIYH